MHAVELGAPLCSKCHRAEINTRNTQFRGKKAYDGPRYKSAKTIPIGFARCWRCGKIKHHTDFRKAASKSNGLQSRCKKCDNIIKTERRKRFH